MSCSRNPQSQSQSHWSLFNATWQKRPREPDHRLRFETEEITLHVQHALHVCYMCAFARMNSQLRYTPLVKHICPRAYWVATISMLLTMIGLRVEFLLKTDSGYPRDAEVTLFTLANPEHSLPFNTHWSAAPVSFAWYRHFRRAVLQKRPMTLRSRLIVATPYLYRENVCARITTLTLRPNTALLAREEERNIARAWLAVRGGGLGSRPIFKKFHETYAPS